MKLKINYILYAIITILIIIIIILLPKKINYSFNYKESFDNLNDGYLYPIKGLQPICEKEGLKPSYMPKACYIDGNLNSYANCKCEDKYGNCKICYDTIKKDDKGSNVVYYSQNFS
jgi:hypothetical protein